MEVFFIALFSDFLLLFIHSFSLVNENMTNLNESWVKGILRQALDVWSRETPLNFREIDAKSKRVDIEIGFSRYTKKKPNFPFFK